MADEKILDTENVSNFIHDIIDSDLAEGRDFFFLKSREKYI